MLTTRFAVRLLVLLFAFSAASRAAAPESPASARPNLVLICLDGVPGDTTGFGGHPIVKTPNLDRLAAESMVFSRAYTPTPEPTGCQASLLTGQYPHQHGVPKEHATVLPERLTVSEILSRAGYTCGLVGVWPLPHPQETPSNGGGQPAQAVPGAQPHPGRPSPAPVRPPAGQPGIVHAPGHPAPGTAHPAPAAVSPTAASQPEVTHATGITASQPMEGSPTSAPATAPAPAVEPPPAPPPIVKPGLGFSYSATSEPGGLLHGGPVYIDGKRETIDGSLADWHTDRAIEFVAQHKDRPFFLAVFLPGPPADLTQVGGNDEEYPAASLPLPTRVQPDPANTPMRLRTAAILQKSPKQPEALRQHQSRYYAFVSQIDRSVGRLLEGLHQTGADRNTLIVVTSGQGYATGQNDAWGTGPAFWEPLVRCPLVVKRPSGRPGRSDRVINLVDIPPTLLETAEAMVPPRMQGRSLLPLIRGEADPYRADECFVGLDQSDGQPLPARVLISEQYKLIDYLQDSDLFYDLKRDPGEQRNLINEPAYATIVRVMKLRLEQWRKRTKDAGSP